MYTNPALYGFQGFGLLLRPLIVDNNKERDNDKNNNVVVKHKVSWVRLSSNLNSLTYYPCKFGQVRETPQFLIC